VAMHCHLLAVVAPCSSLVSCILISLLANNVSLLETIGSHDV
jgi:hypothetical protein